MKHSIRPAFIFLIPLLIAFISCGPDEHHGRIDGELEGINQARILAIPAIMTAADAGGADTIEIKRGKFSYDRPVSEPIILTLLYPNFSQTTLVLEPGKTVRLKGDANRLKEITLDGNDDNLLLTEFRQRMLKLQPREQEREAATFVRSHPATLAALTVFLDFFAHQETFDPSPARSLLETMEKKQPDNEALRQLAAFMKPILSNAPGETIKPFTATDMDGKQFSEADLKGKPTLFIFCAQWQGNFFQISTKSNDIRQDFPTSKLNIIYIVLDERMGSLRKRLKSISLPGRVVCDEKGMSSPLVQALGVRYIGGNILTDAQGKILARDIDLEHWHDKMPAFLKPSDGK